MAGASSGPGHGGANKTPATVKYGALFLAGAAEGSRLYCSLLESQEKAFPLITLYAVSMIY